MATVYSPDYVATQWQVYLIYVALTLLAIALIILFPKQLPRAEVACFWMTCLGFVVSTITVLARSENKQTARTVFADWNNQSGWNNGVAFMIGVGQGMFSFIAIDAATHVAEGKRADLQHFQESYRKPVLTKLSKRRNAQSKNQRSPSNGSDHGHRADNRYHLDDSVHVLHR